MNILLFINPVSRTNKSSLVREILGRENDITLCETAKPNDLSSISQRIRDGKHDIIVSVGGDGFLNEVINGMLLSGNHLPIGIIPAGSMNIFALTAGIPNDTDEACRIILDKNTKKVDLGRIDNGSESRHFLCWAGIGFDTHVIRLVNRYNFIKKKFGGMTAHLIMGIYGFLTYSGTKCTVQSGDTECSGCNLIVSNIELYGMNNLRLAKNAQMDDGYLHARFFRGGKRIDVIRYLAGLAMGKHEDLGDVTCMKSREIRITSPDKLPVHADAEELEMELPGKIDILPKAIEIIVPRAV